MTDDRREKYLNLLAQTSARKGAETEQDDE